MLMIVFRLSRRFVIRVVVELMSAFFVRSEFDLP